MLCKYGKQTSDFWGFFIFSLPIFLYFGELFHERALDMRLVIGNSALPASLAIYHLISNAPSWNGKR